MFRDLAILATIAGVAAYQGRQLHIYAASGQAAMPATTQNGGPTHGGNPATAGSPEAVAAGSSLFQQNCAICHGAKGDGNGIASNVLDPKPRDFHVGKYRLVTSGNGVPFRTDVVRSIQHGVPGTSMPA